jgi:hypothetical protein
MREKKKGENGSKVSVLSKCPEGTGKQGRNRNTVERIRF